MQTALSVLYFDGQRSEPVPSTLEIQGEGKAAHAVLRRSSDRAELRRFPVKAAVWPERTRHGPRMINLPDDAQGMVGGQVHVPSPLAYDAWAEAHLPHKESWLVRAQQSWRGTLAALVLLVGALSLIYLHGLPTVARVVASMVPTSVDEALGSGALEQIDGTWMKPSELPPDVQQRLRTQFETAVKKAHPDDTPKYRLEFRRSEIGPNAFALPGGTIVMTDELVELVNDDQVVLGVLGHELGHITARHGVRQLVQVAAIQVVLSMAFGDYGSLITLAPLMLGSMAYSRDFEREADEDAIRFLHANQISPLVMVRFFSTLREPDDAKEAKKDSADGAADSEQAPEVRKTPLGIAILSSHPSDEERMSRFRRAAANAP